jgi:hypothetical protein
MFMGQGARNVLWGENEADLPPARVVGLSRGRSEGEAVYAISTGVVSGIFAQTVQMQVWGNLVEASQHAEGEAGEGDATRLAAYELVRITKSGVVVVKGGVVGFDVATDGTIYASTGREIVKVTGTKSERMTALEDVTEIVVLG